MDIQPYHRFEKKILLLKLTHHERAASVRVVLVSLRAEKPVHEVDLVGAHLGPEYRPRGIPDCHEHDATQLHPLQELDHAIPLKFLLIIFFIFVFLFYLFFLFT